MAQPDEAGNVLGGAPAMDSWDSWNIDRDGVINNAQSWNYTNRYYVGSEDLDVYGHWVNVPDYGRVWSPTVGGDWSPYRAGRWVWEPYWGWTWVSHEPWGWTPYHYGRWFLYGKSWMWWPGRLTARETTARSGLRPMCRSSDSAATGELPSGSDRWAGCHLVRVIRSIRGTDGTNRN